MARRPLLLSPDAVLPTLWRRWRVEHFLRSVCCAHDGSLPLCSWCYVAAGHTMGMWTAEMSHR